MAVTSKSLIKSIIIFGGAQLISVLAAVVRNKVAAKTIGAAGLGLTAIYQTITQLIANTTNLGLPDSAVQGLSSMQEQDARRNGVAILRLWEIISSCAAFLLIVVSSPLICNIYFDDATSHLQDILFLSIVPPCLIVNNIELAILKSYGERRRLTYTIIAAAALSVIISVPFYVLMKWNGIIYVVVLSAIATAMVSLWQGWRTCNATPDLSLLRRRNIAVLWKKSRNMVLLGLSLVITGIGSMSAELLTQTYLSTMASLAVVGLYKAGYQLSITYPCMIFTAVNNDYYPRLSALGDDVKERNILIRRQIKALLIVTIPCIALLIAIAPYLIQFLLSDEYLAITTLVRIGCLSVIVRCIATPICFVPLATGHSRDFIQMELLSYLVLMLCIIIGYRTLSLTGVGIGILASNFFDLAYGYILARRRYDF